MVGYLLKDCKTKTEARCAKACLTKIDGEIELNVQKDWKASKKIIQPNLILRKSELLILSGQWRKSIFYFFFLRKKEGTSRGGERQRPRINYFSNMELELSSSLLEFFNPHKNKCEPILLAMFFVSFRTMCNKLKLLSITFGENASLSASDSQFCHRNCIEYRQFYCLNNLPK